MSYASDYVTPYYTGTGTSTDVPYKYPIGLDGTGYFLDEQKFADLEARATLPVLRTQADQSNVPGLSSLNPEDLWRRDAESWHHGAGQAFFDRADSDAARFRSSKGVDCWTKWQLSLLPTTTQTRSSANTNVRAVAAGARLYVADGQALAFASTPTGAFTTVTGTPAVAVSALCSDGFKVYAAFGASGVYRTDTGSGAATQLVTSALGASAVVGIAKGRLMVANGASLYNVTDLAGPAALPAALFTHPNTGWTWVGFAEGPAAIYAAGYAGDKSLIYRTATKPDGTGLDVPVVAGELPDGEVVRSVQGYLGYLLVGTDRGVRTALLDAAGNLQFGALINTAGSATVAKAVYCFEPQDRFVWFGWSNYDAASTGLGRLDLSVFPADPLVPAYASDLMASVQGDVLSVVSFGGYRIFTVSGQGVYAEHATNKVSAGTLDSGAISYGIADDKILVFVDTRYSSLPAGTSYDVDISVDGAAFASLASGDVLTTFNANSQRGERFEIRLTLTGSAALTPVLTRWTTRAYPSVRRGEQFLVPIILAETHSPLEGGTEAYIRDLTVARQRLFDLALSPVIVNYQEGFDSWTVLVKDVVWAPDKLGKTGWIGTATLRLLTVSS